MTTLRVLVMAGGTGGHVFPALAVAEELKQRGAIVSWMGTERGMESSVVPKAGFEIDWVNIQGLRGNGLLGWLKAPMRLLKAILQARKIMRQRRPDVVLGMGGFVAGPGGVAARICGIPLVIHEQNSIAGLTNRLLAKIAARVLVAFPDVFAAMNRDYVGNPLRKAIVDSAEPQERMQQGARRLRLLVVGGSLGAAALNEVLPAALALLEQDERPEVKHQTGKAKFDATQQAYNRVNVDAEVMPFIDDMAAAYQWADLVVCRAGALTVSELAAIGVASILIPYPHAVDDHQTTNGQFLVNAGAAEMIQQSALTADVLAQYLRDYKAKPVTLLNMATQARSLAQPKATEVVADICSEVAHV
jgi:UDP-N-acetylglucosamine--N-acetylmuramyl-(pentapeptide) pyrophosphoryl-undecaprenol N-acetylglucosamine transferase